VSDWIPIKELDHESGGHGNRPLPLLLLLPLSLQVILEQKIFVRGTLHVVKMEQKIICLKGLPHETGGRGAYPAHFVSSPSPGAEDILFKGTVSRDTIGTEYGTGIATVLMLTFFENFCAKENMFPEIEMVKMVTEISTMFLVCQKTARYLTRGNIRSLVLVQAVNDFNPGLEFHIGLVHTERGPQLSDNVWKIGST
jgi:hypothetical protein